jgi:sugar phosphate isomerase/epimerase
MRFGVCCPPEMIPAAAAAGFEFWEGTVGACLKPRADDAAFAEALAQLRRAALPCPVVNGFVPADLKITGPAADLSALRQYATTACRRAEQAGVRIIVFGSGGARQVPDGFDRDRARGQLLEFGRMLAPVAERHGVTVVVEPLNRAECNILTTVTEAAALVRDLAHPAVRLLVDAYHFLKDGDSLADLAACADLLRHVHIATVPRRLPPGAEPTDFTGFFEVLLKAGYAEGLSIEGAIPAPATDLPLAMAVFKQLGKR